MKKLKENFLNLFYSAGSNIFKRPGYFGDKGIILTYHRVLPDLEAAQETASLAVPLSRFEDQMRYLSENVNCISIDQVEESLKKNDFFVVVTFDDGYKDNLTYALPALESRKVPATIYVTTRFLEGDTSMWWYEIPSLLDYTNLFCFSWQGRNYRLSTRTLNEKKMAYKEIRKILMSLPYSDQEELLDTIRNKNPRKTYPENVLSKKDILTLASNPLITIGAHTHHHPVLKNETTEFQINEISKSKSILEDFIGKPIEHFAYPFGHQSHAGPREYETAKSLNFKTAVTTIARPLKEDANLLSLPRMSITKRNTITHLKSKINGWNFLLGDFQA